MKGLDVKSVLSDWNDIECATLLARPIFDEAIYGTVRFHHRSVREYLTAEWFAGLLKQESSRRKIEELFFREQYGIEVVVPVMRPILPWLAIFDEKIRDRIRRIEPEVLFEGGDPSQLPLETRRQILRQVCDQLANNVSKRSVTDYASVQRFASADLTVDVQQLILKFAADDDLLSFLLRMVWQGEIVGALPEAKRVALSPTSGRYTRVAAIRAVVAIGSAEDKAELRRSFLNESLVLNRDWLAEILKGETPSAEIIGWLFDSIQKVEEKRPYTVDPLGSQLTEFVGRSESTLLPLIIDRANTLLETPPVIERRHCEVSARYTWLLEAAALAIERLVREKNPIALETFSLAVLHKLRVSQDYDNRDFNGYKSELGALVSKWMDLNIALFWYLVEHERKWLDHKKKERLTDWWSVGIWSSYVQFGEHDFELVVNAITARGCIDDKLIALSLAFWLYSKGGRQPKHRARLKKAVHGDDTLSERLSNLMHPPPQSAADRKHRVAEAHWKRRDEQRRQKEQEFRDGWRKYVTENVEKLRDPGLKKLDDISRAQQYIHERMREGHHNSSSWSEGNWQSLEVEFGVDVARAFRDGAVAYWRHNRPLLVSEGDTGNNVLFSTIFGLTGLAIESREVDRWSCSLNEAEAELAFRYAMRELNGFPSWLPRLFEKFPDVIRRMSLREIASELDTEDAEKDSHYILHDVSWSGDWLWDAVAPPLYKTVEEDEPRNLSNLRNMLNIIQRSSIPDQEIARLAGSKSRSLENANHAAHWFAAWTGVAPNDAIPGLDARLASIASEEDRKTFAMIYVVQLLGGRRMGSSKVREAYRTPKHLKALYLLMHGHIKRGEDIERAGKGGYSPGLRDDAQDARDQLFALLKEIPGKDAFIAMEEISRHHPDEHARPWFRLHARTKAETDANNLPWSAEQVRQFHEEQERTPSTHRDLFDLAVMRLLDLKDDLEGGDSGIASILRTVKVEIEIRKYIGNECRKSSRGRYSIPQEEELADAKRPDLRWHGVGFDAPVPVELKLADNWTGPKLFERLKVQLCGDYLRDVRSRRGIFLLVYRGEKKNWELTEGSGSGVNFEGLVQALQAYWSKISGGYAGIDEIRVIGIDLTKRSNAPIP